MSNSEYSRRLFLNSKNTMRKLIKFFKFLIVPALIMAGTVSCNKNELDVKPSDTGQSNAPKITTNQLGILEFKDIETFKQTVDELKALTLEKRIMWEKEHGFTSLKSIYQEVLKNESEVLKNLEIKVDVTNAKMSDFPNVHSKAFDIYKSSLISTGENILNTPLMNVGIGDYSNLINKDGFVKIGEALFEFKKGVIKASKISGIISETDLNAIKNTTNSNTLIKVFSASPTNKSAKVAQSGHQNVSNSYGGYIVSGDVYYSDQYIFGSPNDIGAVYLDLGFFGFWLTPVVSIDQSMQVLTPSWYGWGISAEANCSVGMRSNFLPSSYGLLATGFTNNDGIYSISYYWQGNGNSSATVSNMTILNAGFYIGPYPYTLICSMIRYI
jgi:hypothetical protein